MEESKIENAPIINDNPSLSANINENEQISNTQTNSGLEIHRLFYVIGLILMLLAYVGPYLYFKYYKKKNFLPCSKIGVKHAI